MNPYQELLGKKVMSPGPTQVHDRVRAALAGDYTNPDLDPAFLDFYRDTAEKLNTMIGNKGVTYLLCGEGILGLEAACASFIEPGDKVLTISNGIFGKGFDGFSTLYGGQTSLFESDLRKGIDLESLETFIREKGPFKVATLVHCETPSGITNDVEQIGKILNAHGILSIVDSVSALGGEEMAMAKWGLDVVLCASQKAFSSPVGISTVSLSEKALAVLRNRKSTIPGFYANLQIWDGYYEKQWFPYTQPIHLIAAFREALDGIQIEESVLKHNYFAQAIRETFLAAGFELYPQDSFANTVTTICLPQGLDFKPLQDRLLENHQTMVGGGFDMLANRIFRIGHMGENANREDLTTLLVALEECFSALGVTLKSSLAKTFVAVID